MSYWNWNWDCLLLKHLFVSISPNPCCRLRHLLGAHVNNYKGTLPSVDAPICACKMLMYVCVCVHDCAWHMQACALACIHVCIEGITYTARLMWKSCSEPHFYILFIISWHNVGNRLQCSFLASACKPWPGWMTEGVLRQFQVEQNDGCKMPVCHLLPFVSTQTVDMAPGSIPRPPGPLCNTSSCNFEY